MHAKRNFLLEKGKCSYESVVEMPDLVLVLLLTYFYTFVLVCILIDYSWMGSQAVYLYRRQPTWNLSFQIMLCYVKLFIYEEVLSKIQLLEYLSLSIFFLFHHFYDTVLIQKGLKVLTWWHLCIVEAAHNLTPRKTWGQGSRGYGCLWVQQSSSIQRPADPEAGSEPRVRLLAPWCPAWGHWASSNRYSALMHKKPVNDTGPSRFTCHWTLHVVLSQMSWATCIS